MRLSHAARRHQLHHVRHLYLGSLAITVGIAACKDAVTFTLMSREKLLAPFLVRLMQSRMWRLGLPSLALSCPNKWANGA